MAVGGLRRLPGREPLLGQPVATPSVDLVPHQEDHPVASRHRPDVWQYTIQGAIEIADRQQVADDGDGRFDGRFARQVLSLQRA